MKRCQEQATCGDLIDAQLEIGTELFGLLCKSGCRVFDCFPFKLRKMDDCCQIPEPCWAPLALGEARCSIAPGGNALMHFIVTNEDYKTRTLLFSAAGPDAAYVTFSVPSVTLGPKARVSVYATFSPPNVAGAAYESMLWVRGAREHYARWNVDLRGRAKTCCHEVDVNDKPDYVVHWYDHFYCGAPCGGDRAAQSHASGA